MSTQSGMWVPDTSRPIFDPHLDIATVVFSHVRCVRDPPQPRPGEQVVEGRLQACRCVPSQFDLDAFPDMPHWRRGVLIIIGLLDNDEALSLPYERVVGLLGETAEDVCELLC